VKGVDATEQQQQLFPCCRFQLFKMISLNGFCNYRKDQLQLSTTEPTNKHKEFEKRAKN
jgi:hypothetical protein